MPRLLKYPVSRGHLLKTSTKCFFFGSGAYRAPNLHHTPHSRGLRQLFKVSSLSIHAAPSKDSPQLPHFQRIPVENIDTIFFTFFGSNAYRTSNLDHIIHLTAEANDSYLSYHPTPSTFKYVRIHPLSTQTRFLQTFHCLNRAGN